jgi:hypothetical protein
VGLAAAGSAGSGAPLDMTVIVLDGFGRSGVIGLWRAWGLDAA